jgi:hypothetical protein
MEARANVCVLDPRVLELFRVSTEAILGKAAMIRHRGGLVAEAPVCSEKSVTLAVGADLAPGRLVIFAIV